VQVVHQQVAVGAGGKAIVAASLKGQGKTGRKRGADVKTDRDPIGPTGNMGCSPMRRPRPAAGLGAGARGQHRSGIEGANLQHRRRCWHDTGVSKRPASTLAAARSDFRQCAESRAPIQKAPRLLQASAGSKVDCLGCCGPWCPQDGRLEAAVPPVPACRVSAATAGGVRCR
jgi:hypothetical protein